jgi:hypothetical protein
MKDVRVRPLPTLGLRFIRRFSGGERQIFSVPSPGQSIAHSQAMQGGTEAGRASNPGDGTLSCKSWKPLAYKR